MLAKRWQWFTCESYKMDKKFIYILYKFHANLMRNFVNFILLKQHISLKFTLRCCLSLLLQNASMGFDLQWLLCIREGGARWPTFAALPQSRSCHETHNQYHHGSSKFILVILSLFFPNMLFRKVMKLHSLAGGKFNSSTVR